MFYRTAAWLPAIFFMLAGLSQAQTTVPSTTLDQTTPRGALKLFLLANSRSDGAAMRSLIQTTSPGEERMAAAMCGKKTADRELTLTLDARFPNATQPASPPVTEADLAPVFDKIDQASQTLSGGTATLSAAGENAPPFTLKLAGDKWMIPLSVLLPNVEPPFLADQAHQIEIQIDVMQAAAADVKSGKYATRADAIEDIKRRIFDTAIADHVAAAKPATQP